MFFTHLNIFVYLLVLINIYQIECKFEWKSKPNTSYRVNENETIKLDCEFQNSEDSQQQYFVIWSKNGTTLALNNQLANLNSTNLEITGSYNLVLKDLQSSDSGVYRCQLFQSNDLYVNINLTVLVPPKYLKINIENQEEQKVTELIEGERIKLDCCTNADANPQVQFKWFKQSLINSKSTTELINNNNVRLLNENYLKDDGLICNGVEINVNRYDNNYEYKCSVSNEALAAGLIESVKLIVEYKPEVSLHVENMPKLVNKIDLIEHFDTINSFSLVCNATAMPDNDLVYEWYMNDMLLSGMTEQYLSLKNLNQSANYSCKCTNKHGYDQSHLYVNILYAKLRPLNTSETIDFLQDDEVEKKEILIKSSVNSNITLNCELKTNYYSNDIRINWYYYKYQNEKPLKLDANGIVQMHTTIKTSENLKLISSKLSLNELNEHQFGYYACNVENYKVKNSYEQVYDLNLNSTYFLQVQFAPNIKVNRNALFTTNNDQLEMVCEIESNPESIFVWLFNNREIASNYKYNITTKIIYKNNDFNELNKISFIQSKLIINSINNFDYGTYVCKATNLIGEAIKTISVERKRAPDTPKNISISKLSSTSLILNWVSGANGGEQQQFLLTINNTINITISVNSVQNEFANESVEIKNLKSLEVYEMKLLAFNKIGSSDYSDEFLVQTTDKKLITDNSIQISNAKYKLSDNKIKKFSDEICFDAKLNHENTHLNVRINILSNNMTNELLINDIKIINGLNCIEYTKYLNKESKNERLVVAYLPTFMKRLSDGSVDSVLHFTNDLPIPAATIALCLMTDSSMCTQETTITNTLIDISNYFTLIAIACSILFIFILLIIVSICCCCLRKHRNNKSNTNSASKLTVTAIPSLSISYPQSHIIDCSVSDDSTKSTQRIMTSGGNFYHIPGNNNIHVSDDSSKFSKYSQPTSSSNTALTVESDVISSASSSAISSGGDSSLQSKLNSNNVQSGYCVTDHGINTFSLSKQGLLYAPQMKSQQQQHSTLSQESAESGYSTPTNFNKKLFYEVIV